MHQRGFSEEVVVQTLLNVQIRWEVVAWLDCLPLEMSEFGFAVLKYKRNFENYFKKWSQKL